MLTPTTASYQQLLEALEDRLWIEQVPEDFEYLVELVNDLYLKTLETHVATLNGCLNYGFAPETDPKAKRRHDSLRRNNP